MRRVLALALMLAAGSDAIAASPWAKSLDGVWTLGTYTKASEPATPGAAPASTCRSAAVSWSVSRA